MQWFSSKFSTDQETKPTNIRPGEDRMKQVNKIKGHNNTVNY